MNYFVSKLLCDIKVITLSVIFSFSFAVLLTDRARKAPTTHDERGINVFIIRLGVFECK